MKIGKVTDARPFELDPEKPSIASLKDGDIGNPAIRARAIARKRNTFGKGMGDILLPEGRTIERLVAEIVTSALRSAGYRVLAEGDPGYEEAPALDTTIEAFWAWMTPGFATVSLDFMASLAFQGIEGLASAPVGASGHTNPMAADSDAWMETIELGIADLNQQIRLRLKQSAAP